MGWPFYEYDYAEKSYILNEDDTGCTFSNLSKNGLPTTTAKQQRLT